AQIRENRTRGIEYSRKSVGFLELERMTVAIPLKSDGLRPRHALNGKDSRRGRGRVRIADKVKGIQPEIGHVFQWRKRRDQFQVAEDDKTPVAQEVARQDRAELQVIEAVLGGKPNLAVGPDIQRVESVIAVHRTGMEAGEQLLMAFDEPARVGEDVTPKQHSNL